VVCVKQNAMGLVGVEEEEKAAIQSIAAKSDILNWKTRNGA
jgi:hypothetical protein